MTGAHKIRVVHIVQALEQGGMEEVVATYAARLDQQRFEVSVVTFRAGAVAERIGSMPGVRLAVIPGRPAARMGRLIRWLAGAGADVVHNHFNWYGLSAARLARVPVRLETVHNVYSWLGPLRRSLYSASVLPATMLIAVSPQVAEYTRARFWGAREKQFCVIGNGIDARRFCPGPGNKGLRRRLGIPDGAVVAGFVGRLAPEKNLAALLEAAEAAGSAGTSVAVLLAGAGTAEEDLRRQAGSLHKTKVIFAGHVQDPEKIFRLMDIVVFPSSYEGIPLGLLQGMATSKPAVVTRVGGMPDVVADGVSGLIVPPGDPGALAAAIRSLALDPERRRSMGERARERVVAAYTDQEMVHKTEQLYLQLLALTRR